MKLALVLAASLIAAPAFAAPLIGPTPPSEPMVTIPARVAVALFQAASEPSCERRPLIDAAKASIGPQIQALQEAEAKKAAPPLKGK
jgi:hypothetical protein